MNFGQWIGNRHRYRDAHEEGERGDEGEGGGSNHVDVVILISVSLETLRNTRVLLILMCKSLSSKAWVLDSVIRGCLVRGSLIWNLLDKNVYELGGTRT